MLSLDHTAQRLLPRRLYIRFQASDLARRLARGSAYSLLGTTAFRLLALVGMIFVARILGQEEFGALALVQATLGVLGLLAGIGLGGTATRFVAQYAQSQPDRAGWVIALVYLTSAVAIAIASAILVLGSGFVAETLLGAPGLRDALIWGALFMALQAARSVQIGVWTAFERFEALAALNLVEGTLNVVLLIGLTSAFGLNGALMALAASAGVTWLIGYVWLRRELASRHIKVTLRGAWSERHILVRYALPHVLSTVVTTPVLWFAMTMVSQDEAGLAGLGLYNAAYQWHGPAMFIPMMINAAAVPALVHAWHDGRPAQFRTIANSMYVLVLALTLPVAVIGSLASPVIMALFGPEFRDGWPMLVLLLSAAPVVAIGKVAANTLLAVGRAPLVLAINAVWGVVMLGGTLVLLPGSGALALAISFLVAHAAATLGLVIASRSISISSAPAQDTTPVTAAPPLPDGTSI